MSSPPPPPATAVVSNNSSSRKKKRRLQSQTQPKESASHARWKTEAQERIYSSKLIEALSKVNLNPSSPSAPRRGRAVREAADRALASAARGRSLWSHAILSTRRVKLKFRKQNNKHKNRSVSRAAATVTGSIGSPRKARLRVRRLQGNKSLPDVQRKARVLGRLVPGCRKQPLPVILEEATDYIAALEMQIKTMSALADLLSSAASSSSSAAPPSSSPSNN